MKRSSAARRLLSSFTLSGCVSLARLRHSVLISFWDAVALRPSTLYAFCSPSASIESMICFQTSDQP
uniref:Uncharacterized protein n=1 Tax=Anopheles braziliensis TaxID=58242 RepID=A0A2M3ZLF0_9DIPT